MRTIAQVRSSIRRLKSKLADAERSISETRLFAQVDDESNVMDLEIIEDGLTYILQEIEGTVEFWNEIRETNKRLEGVGRNDRQ